MFARPILKASIIASSIILPLAQASVAFAAPSFKLTSPSIDQKIESQTVVVTWDLAGVTLTDYTKTTRNNPSQGHVHLWLDEPAPTAQNAIKVTTGNSYSFEGVKSGSHTLLVEVQNNDHSSFKPKLTQAVNFETTSPIYINPPLPQNDFTLFLILVAIILVGGLWYFLSPETVMHTPKQNTSKKSSKSRRK